MTVVTGRAVSGGVPVAFRPLAEAVLSGLRRNDVLESPELRPFRRALGPRDPRGRRRPLGGHRRHPRALRPRSSSRSRRNRAAAFIDRMIGLAEGAVRRKTPNEIALGILLAAMTLIFVIVVATLAPFGDYAAPTSRPSRWSRCWCR